MDRLDRWLNAQRGWRRLLARRLIAVPPLVSAGLWWSAWGNIDDQGTVSTGSVVMHVAIAALAGMPLAVVAERLQVRRLKSRPWEPGFSWRQIVGMEVVMVSQAILAYGNTRTWAWRRQHLSFKLLFLVEAAGLVLLIWNWIYLRKLRRLAEDAQLPAG